MYNGKNIDIPKKKKINGKKKFIKATINSKQLYNGKNNYTTEKISREIAETTKKIKRKKILFESRDIVIRNFGNFIKQNCHFCAVTLNKLIFSVVYALRKFAQIHFSSIKS